MNAEVINCMLNNSTWANPEDKNIYKFSNGKELSINGKSHFKYSLNSVEDKIIIQLGYKKEYYIKYINDFTLYLYNDEEKFRIIPEYS
jgi:hypothetical protein